MCGYEEVRCSICGKKMKKKKGLYLVEGGIYYLGRCYCLPCFIKRYPKFAPYYPELAEKLGIH